MEKFPAVYIMANRYRGTIYIGVTSKLWSRVWDHKTGRTPDFFWQCNVTSLVWYEHRMTMEAAILREKRMKELEAELEDRADREDEPGVADLHDEIDALATLVEE